MQGYSTQDQSRLALTQSILERRTLNIDPYRDTNDKSFYYAAAAVFLVTTAGNEYPTGGHSPGLRYFAPALGWLLLGLPESFRRWPRATAVVAAVSVGIATFNALAWMENSALTLRHELPRTIWSAAGLPAEAGHA